MSNRIHNPEQAIDELHNIRLTKREFQGNPERLNTTVVISHLNGDFFIRISDCFLESDRTGASCACPDRQGSQNTLSVRTGCATVGVENSGCSFVFCGHGQPQLKTTEAFHVH